RIADDGDGKPARTVWLSESLARRSGHGEPRSRDAAKRLQRSQPDGPDPASCRSFRSAFMVGTQSIARGNRSRPDFAGNPDAVHGTGISRGQAVVRRRGGTSRTPDVLGWLKRNRPRNARFPAFHSRIDPVTLAASGIAGRRL